jgi:anti-sigma regulatory factor (Ser/Thr protein kinase)
VSYSIPPEDRAPRVARHHVARQLDDLESRLVEDVTLMVSELVSNAVLYGEGEIGLMVEKDVDKVRVTVTDQGRAEPVAHGMPESEAIRGRGLAIVDRLSHRWGVRTDPHGGTAVWFECAIPSPDGRPRL